MHMGNNAKPEEKERTNTRTRRSRDCIQIAVKRQRASFAIFTSSNRKKRFESWDFVEKVTYFGDPVRKKTFAA